ncbi:MAG: DNA repair protein RecN [Paramuribaculum sp.]|nr:DNA repair protein RecN [Paramuribaculum sp.]
MLQSLHISNFALIESMDIEFHQGLNIITGETGAGKSIILGALSLLLGERAESRMLRNPENKTVIEGIFSIDTPDSLKSLMDGEGITWFPEQCIMRREILPSGRSRAFINDTPVTVTLMQSVGEKLIDIHSQHNNRLLASAEFQMRIIDSIADNQQLLADYDRLFQSFRKSLRRLKSLKAAIAKDREDEEFITFQLDKLDRLDIQPDELSSLMLERETIADNAEIKNALETALQCLCSGQPNIESLLDTVTECTDTLESHLSADDNIPSRLKDILVEIRDITDTFTSLNDRLGTDTRNIEEIDDRISDITAAMKRHNVDTPEELISLHEGLRNRLNRLNDAPTLLADAEAKARHDHHLAMEAAKAISASRRKAAEAFSTLLTDTARPLGMKNLICDVKISPADISATGIDNIEFLFAFNKNQTPMPVNGVASGGEISRLMLCIKSIIADRLELPAIVFDEVDTGVSGDIASRIGMLLHNISKSLQVITITHLPQVAAQGDHHYKVFKSDDDTSTLTRISQLNANERIEELALMLSGYPVSDAARANARDLLSHTSH